LIDAEAKEGRVMSKNVGFPEKIHLDRCIEVAGNARAGVLLYRILIRVRRSEVRRGGRPWTCHSRQEWAEATGTSLKKVKADLDKLSALDLIVREGHLFNNRRVLFLTPTAKCLMLVGRLARWMTKRTDLEGPHGDEGEGPAGTGPQVPEGTDEDIIKKVLEKDTRESRAAGAATPSGGSDKKEEEDKGHAPGVVMAIDQGGSSMNAAEVAAKANTPKSVDMLQPDEVASLDYVWRVGFRKRGTTAPAITRKARGQFATLIRNWPTGMAPALLEFALINWVDVREDAEARFSAFNSPLEPELGYLVRYAHVVTDLFRKGGSAPAEADPPPIKPIPRSVEKKLPPKPAAAEKAVTFEEMLAIEAEMDEVA
jgi:hypothetical protein